MLLNNLLKDDLSAARAKVVECLFSVLYSYIVLPLPAVLTAAHLACVLVAPLNSPKAVFSPY